VVRSYPERKPKGRRPRRDNTRKPDLEVPVKMIGRLSPEERIEEFDKIALERAEEGYTRFSSIVEKGEMKIQMWKER